MSDEQFKASTYPPERQLLIDCVTECPGNYVVEIGAFYGSTTVHLAKAAEDSGKRLWVVDPWSGYYAADETVYGKFLDNIEPWKEIVTVVREKSQDAEIPHYLLQNSCLVFVDGDHDGDAPYEDAIKYWPCVAPGGIMAFHDYYDPRHAPHVQRAVEQFVKAQPMPQTVYTMRYLPTIKERFRHNAKYGETGLAWIRKGDE